MKTTWSALLLGLVLSTYTIAAKAGPLKAVPTDIMSSVRSARQACNAAMKAGDDWCKNHQHSQVEACKSPTQQFHEMLNPIDVVVVDSWEPGSTRSGFVYDPNVESHVEKQSLVANLVADLYGNVSFHDKTFLGVTYSQGEVREIGLSGLTQELVAACRARSPDANAKLKDFKTKLRKFEYRLADYRPDVAHFYYTNNTRPQHAECAKGGLSVYKAFADKALALAKNVEQACATSLAEREFKSESIPDPKAACPANSFPDINPANKNSRCIRNNINVYQVKAGMDCNERFSRSTPAVYAGECFLNERAKHVDPDAAAGTAFAGR